MKRKHVAFATKITAMFLVAVSVSVTAWAAITPPSPPQFVSLTWSQIVSIKKDRGVETWTASVTNPQPSEPEFAVVNVNGVDSSGADTFSNNSTVFQINPGQTISRIDVTHTFQQNQIGENFIFQALILWGTSQSSINSVSNSTEVGHFFIHT